MGSLRRLAARPHGGPSDARARLLESLPRALTGACERASPLDGGQWATFTATDGNGKGWRRYALACSERPSPKMRTVIGPVPEWLMVSSKVS